MAWPPAIVAVHLWRGGSGRLAAQMAQPAAGEAADVLQVPLAVLLVAAALGPAQASDRCPSADWPHCRSHDAVEGQTQARCELQQLRHVA